MSEENKYELVKFIDGEFELEVNVSPKEDTVWMTLDQISMLFDRNKSVISRHIKKIFVAKELEEKSVVAKNATTAKDGKIYQVTYYNLDVIIAVGYKVNSIRGTIFRKWANKVLKEYLVKGYVINEHIKNILKNELSEYEVVRKFGKTELSNVKTKPILFYNLDLILAVGYRVKSKRGIIFRK